MHRVWVLAAALCAGCFSKPGFSGGGGNGDGGIDATDGSTDGTGDGSIDAPPCTGAWATPVAVVGLENDVTGEPTATGDLEELYWAYQNGAAWKIHWGSVIQPGSLSYTNRGRAPFHTVDDGIDQDPSITDDGLLLVYRVGTGEQFARLKQVTRPDRTTGWSAPAEVPGLSSIVPFGLDISGDGLTLYYNVGQTLKYATRANRVDPFVEQPGNIGSSLLFPAISGDQLTIYVTTNFMGVDMATRMNRISAFGTKSPVFSAMELHDPDVTADGKTMVMGTDTNNTIAISRRMCP